ncbi:MAG: MAPEG family protein [Nostoc sp. EfeVER01]|uniref:MAPEG family protein n=1 Tax=unclassified Nostoc TaxID=2593658 RepID=UPI002AD2E263|nr:MULTISPECIES: MAPEG family protein [unclassified Nostoc]MDZ7947504.1 MAPEG family protein [Nostoc sp. EfeVER01]MDZ7996071.1 MAPEG family protein [Nostoc sp. EspVER01]
MIENTVPISTIFIGINGLIAFSLSYIAAFERTKTRVWHGESKEDVAAQPDPLANPNPWASMVEQSTQKFIKVKVNDYGLLQRKVRAHGNFAEYVPHALLFVLALELMQAQTWLLWLFGSSLTVARIAHAWGLIKTYGPSPGRALGFFLTWFVYVFGSIACIYYGLVNLMAN